MRFRQIHLDFHTSGAIPGIGTGFEREEFQRTLQEAAVDSITCFAVCHHGWSYHPTAVGIMHPGLHFDLLRAQIDAAHAIDVAVPVYISAGASDAIAERHPEWEEQPPRPEMKLWGRRSPLEAGFRKLCFNTEYLDHLCALIDEVVTRYADCDGIFLDIVVQSQCCCPKCVRDMAAQGLDASSESDRLRFVDQVMERYYQRTTTAARRGNARMRVFHNSGHVSSAHLDRLRYFSHLELESLPTGGWGYDHFPQSAAFARQTGLEFLGMTGKFHSSWGEFGGIKHPNALRYECAAMLAFGSKCSIGDQLHPSGRLDAGTYRVVGAAYREVRAKEAFCRAARNVADIALITAESCGLTDTAGDIGAARILLEGHFLFDILNPQMDFSGYRMVILPDNIPVDADLQRRLAAFEGKILFSGDSGFACDWEIGPAAGFSPTYLLPAPAFRPDFCETPFVMYGPNRALRVPASESLGEVFFPWFNRRFDQFSSHQHAPNHLEPSGLAAGALRGRVAYLAHRVFTLYRQTGAVALRQYVTRVIAALLGDDATIESNLPSMARCAVTRQEERWVVHLLYGNMVLRGGGLPGNAWLGGPIEVIEELLPLTKVEFALRHPGPVRSVRLEPQGIELPFEVVGDRVRVQVESFTCHQMVVVEPA